MPSLVGSEMCIRDSYYIDAAKQKLFEIVRDLGDLLKPIIIECFNPSNQAESNYEQHVEYPNSILVIEDFYYLEDSTKNYQKLLNEMIDAIGHSHHIKFIFFYSYLVENAFYNMPQILNQNFEVEKLKGRNYKELYHLRRTLVEVGEIDFNFELDLKGLKPFKFDIFVPKRLNLI